MNYNLKPLNNFMNKEHPTLNKNKLKRLIRLKFLQTQLDYHLLAFNLFMKQQTTLYKNKTKYQSADIRNIVKYKTPLLKKVYNNIITNVLFQQNGANAKLIHFDNLFSIATSINKFDLMMYPGIKPTFTGFDEFILNIGKIKQKIEKLN